MRISSTLILAVVACTGATTVSAQGMQRDPARRFAQADANHDGRVSLQEFQASRAGRFEQLDRNHDGFITDADLPRFVRNNSRWSQMAKAMEQMADVNHDGRVSRDEFMAAGQELFATVDVNHDGFVDQAEMQQARERVQALAKH